MDSTACSGAMQNVCSAAAFLGCFALSTLCFPCRVRAAQPDVADVKFAQVGSRNLLLDIYQPVNRSGPAPLVVWVHGGAWRAGTRASVPITELTDHGYAVASVDYRLSVEATFPAQVHDIKAAIRFLRANSDSYDFDPRQFTIAGASAGGHLAALVGVSNQVDALEGAVGKDLKVSSDVQAIVSFYGASNLETILSQSTPHGLSVRVPALQMLLAGQPTNEPALARLASPVAHVDASDPPLLLIHGDQDPQMPINQSHELHGAYLGVAASSSFHVVYGGAHGGRGFYESEMIRMDAAFLDELK